MIRKPESSWRVTVVGSNDVVRPGCSLDADSLLAAEEIFWNIVIGALSGCLMSELSLLPLPLACGGGAETSSLRRTRRLAPAIFSGVSLVVVERRGVLGLNGSRGLWL